MNPEERNKTVSTHTKKITIYFKNFLNTTKALKNNNKKDRSGGNIR